MARRVLDALDRTRLHALRRVPPLRALDDRRYATRLARHRPRLPALDAHGRALLDELEREGVVVTRLDALGGPWPLPVDGLRSLRSHLGADAPPGPRSLAVEALGSHPEVWRWGLAPGLLDLVEAYVGLPVRYHGVTVRRDPVDGVGDGVRQWHRDVEDRRMVKVLVWLHDVDAGAGPFEHLPAGVGDEAARRLKYVSGFVGDASMSPTAPPSTWRSCTGPAWTAIVADTARVLHRAKPPSAQPRDSATYTWTSRHPLRTYPATHPSPGVAHRLLDGLDARQLACVPAAWPRPPVA